MPFHYMLTNLLVDVPEAVGAIFLDDEGEAIEWVTSEAPWVPNKIRIKATHSAIQSSDLRQKITNPIKMQINANAISKRSMYPA